MHYQSTRRVHVRTSNRIRNAVLSVVCSAALAVGMCPVVALAQGAAGSASSADSADHTVSLASYDPSSHYSVTISSSVSTAKPGTTFDVTLDAETDNSSLPLSSLEVRVAYDRNKVRVAGVKGGTIANFAYYDDKAGLVGLNFFENTSARVKVATISFEVLGDASGDPGIYVVDALAAPTMGKDDYGVNFPSGNIKVTIPEAPTPPSAPTPPASSSDPSASPTATPEQQNQAAIEQGYMGVQSVVENLILTTSSEEGAAGATFTPMKAKASKITKKSLKLSWTAVKDAKLGKATKYVIFGSKCKTKMKKIATTASKSFKVKKLKKGTYYKYQIMALDSKGRVIAVSKVVHAATKGGKVTNYKSLSISGKKVKKGKVTLKKGKSLKLKVKKTKASKKQKIKTHRKVKFETTNKKVATVTSKGKVKAKGKGKCYVYAYAQNGVCAKVKVTVK